MKIRKVTAHAFGPFVGETLELAPGMTIVRGPNEAGKSTWHSAIYAALCGMRRAHGRRRSEDEAFAERHQPWDGDRWDVACELALPGGRRLELRHDLAGGVECSAVDLDLGTDVSEEIISEGSPDGSRWLGIDRRIFLAVACVRQAEILEVTQHTDTLQETLQRAAATAGTQETAVTALSAIESFKSEAVGTRRSNSTRPLKKAIERLEQAERARDHAVTEHGAWLAEQERSSSLDDDARDAEARLRCSEWELLRRRITGLESRCDEAALLADRYPLPPPELATDDEVADLATNAIRSWEERPTVTPPVGPSAVELQRELDALPPAPDGDIESHPAVEEAKSRHEDALRRHEEQEQRRPDQTSDAATEGWSSQQLLDLARELDAVVPPVDEALANEVERLRQAGSEQTTNMSRPLFVAGGVIAAAGAVALLLGLVAAGAALLVIGVALVAGGSWFQTKTPTSPGENAELRDAEMRLVVAEQMRSSAQAQRDSAQQRAHAAGLPTDTATLRQLANATYEAERAMSNQQAWDEERTRMLGDLASARDDLRAALASRAVTGTPDDSDSDLQAAYTDYRHACRERWQASSEAARRPGLEQAVAARKREEGRYAADLARIEAAEARLREAVAAVSLPDADESGTSPDELVESLRRWLKQRSTRRASAQTARREWDRLQTLLDGRPIDQLIAERDREVRRLASMARPDETLLAEIADHADELVDTIRDLRETAEAARQRAVAASSEVRVKAGQLKSVPEAEEEFAAAQQELARLETLEAALALTAGFLESAQERVHRDIAPVLRAKVRDRLARITGGRYSDVIIDPEDLAVKVRDADGHWRNASHLSHGTAEQVFLLLRIAIAEILTTDGANCPLLLDDATVQSDPVRTRAVLDVLHAASSDHQIILFSQEVVVGEWAEHNLTDRDQLVTLQR